MKLIRLLWQDDDPHVALYYYYHYRRRHDLVQMIVKRLLCSARAEILV